MTTQLQMPIEALEARSPFSWLRERDIDLLLCAELHACGGPKNLLASRLGYPDSEFSGAWVSHAEHDGESDLIAAFETKDGLVLALVENKIAAPFQPEQGQRAGPACLNRISASISGASAGVRPPRGAAEG
jgi:hypothetical protein